VGRPGVSSVTTLESERASHEVLVVDDNPATLYTTARILRAAGFRTKQAATGSEALRLSTTGVSAVILDLHLPDIDGFEVCGRIRRRPETALLPVIHLSASYVQDADKVRGLEAGADAYMTHPAEPALLVATLQALIRARTAEEAMRRSDAGFRAIYEEAPSGISLLDAEGRFSELNPAMLSFLRRESSAVVGRKITDFAPPDWHERIRDAMARSRVGVWRGEFPLLDGAGELVHMEWSLSSNARSGSVLAIATDVSERMALFRQREELLEREQAARAAAEAVNRSKDEFIAVLSHELRTPLNAIVGWCHVLNKPVSAETLARGIEAIQRNARVQTRLISDILDVSRIRLGKLPLKTELVEPLEIVDESVKALTAALTENSLQISVDARQPIRPIVADPARVQQIVWNLLTNAIKFSRPGGAIRISLLQDIDQLTLSVEDDGEGIDPGFLPFVFDRFAQSAASSNRKHGGLGLGLSIVKQLAALHGGSVHAFSAGRGCGAKFSVVLPQVADTPTDLDNPFSEFDQQDNGVDRQGRLAGLTIAVIDDDDEARELLGTLLRSEEANTLEANGYEAALALLERNASIDVLVSDIGMPGKDGYHLIQELRRRDASAGRHTPAIALTAFARAKDRDAALAAGFDAHCAKPVRPTELISAILAAAGR
jgi:PAS domain S-box-containing protein